MSIEDVCGTQLSSKEKIYGIYDSVAKKWLCNNNNELYQFYNIHVAQAKADLIAEADYEQWAYYTDEVMATRPIRARLYGDEKL